jgi:transposase
MLHCKQDIYRRCFCVGKNEYTSEIKWSVVRDKLEGKLTTREIMGKYDIKNKSQVETWVRWYKKGEIYRFDQPIGKQYSYGHGPEFASEDERISNQVTHLKMENEILKKYLAMKKEWIKE